MKKGRVQFSIPKLTLFVLLISMFGCATKPVNISTPLSFESAVRIAAGKILKDGQMKLGPLLIVKSPLFVIDQIINSDTGEANATSKKIEELIISESKNFRKITVETMNSGNISKADYVIVGVLSQEVNSVANKKIPHLFLSLVEVNSNKVISAADVWIADRGDLNFEPTPVYKDSPVYLKDDRVDALIATAKAQAGSFVNQKYIDSLTTNALLDEASSYYDDGEFTHSLGLFAKAAERPDGRVMRTFAGLYQNFIKIGRIEDAQLAFFQLLDLGIAENNMSIKFLFQVDSTRFYGTQEELLEFKIWIEEIANIVIKNNVCLEVIGHASKSGSFQYNDRLSRKRAYEIQSKLVEQNPAIRSMVKASGRGFTENIIGTGTNDYRDAIDRRVDFRLIDCGTM